MAELGDELDELIECAGDNCRGAPAATLTFANGGTGENGCVIAPITASLNPGPDDGPIVGVTFRAGKTLIGTDNEAPYEAPIPDAAIRAEQPKRATVLAETLYTDGRRLTLPAKIRLCS